MNSAQRRIFLTFHRFRSAFSGRAFDNSSGDYFVFEAEVKAARKLAEDGIGPPVFGNLLTADHLFRKRDEAFHQLQPLLEDEHFAKDNTGRDAQILFVKRLLAKEKDPGVRVVLGHRLRQLEGGMSMADIGRAEAKAYEGMEPPEYLVAAKADREVGAPARKARRKAGRRAIREGKKRWLAKHPRKAARSKPEKPVRSNPRAAAPMSYSSIPRKVMEQRARPVLNGSRA